MILRLKPSLGVFFTLAVFARTKYQLKHLFLLKGTLALRIFFPKEFYNLLNYTRFDNKYSLPHPKTNKRPVYPHPSDLGQVSRKSFTTLSPRNLNITVDEQFEPFCGRCPFDQYIPSKQEKYGRKIFWAGDSENNHP